MPEKKFYIDGMCFFIPLEKLRSTPKVEFDIIPIIDELGSIDRVKHDPGAYSPSLPDSDEKPWYMHPNQEDNLIVFHGKRFVYLYTKDHSKTERFEVTPNYVKYGDTFVYEGRCLFGWPEGVFHRVHSPEGSISVNFAKRSAGFDIKTNFNIYRLNTESGDYQVLREGHKDQGVD
jgi:hypothetical protein